MLHAQAESPLAVAVGLGVLHDQGAGRPPLYEGPNPYDLRGAFVSLMVWEGRTMLEVSGLAGHGVDVCERPLPPDLRGV